MPSVERVFAKKRLKQAPNSNLAVKKKAKVLKVMDQLNKLKEENIQFKIDIRAVKCENSYLKKVMRDQNHALVGAAEKNNESAMKALLAENKKLRGE